MDYLVEKVWSMMLLIRRHFLGALSTTRVSRVVLKDIFLGVHTRSEQAKRREQTVENMELVMGRLPHKKKPPLAVNVLKTDDLPVLKRMKITHVSEAGNRVPVYLLKPKHIRGKTPGTLCLHQTTSLGPAEPTGVAGNPDLYYALELAERDYITVAPAYPGCGEYDFGGHEVDPYQLGYVSGAMKAIWNHMMDVDVLQSLPEVAADRIGCIGHSPGGHNTLLVSAFDTRIRVMVTSCGFTSFEKYYGGRIRPWGQRCMMPRVATRYGNDPSARCEL